MRTRLSAIAFPLFCIASFNAAAQDEFPDAPPADAKLIVEGLGFPEGPAIDRSGVLYFTDTVKNEIRRWDGNASTLFASKTNGGNGLAFDKDGALYACQGSGAVVAKYDASGNATKFVDSVEGKPLNRPNDLVFDFSGNLFFTNPHGQPAPDPNKPLPSVVRVRGGEAKVVSTDLEYPNGIGLSPDGKFLYVNDSRGGCATWRFPLDAKGDVGKGEILIEFGEGKLPDGMAVAESGNVYVALNRASKIVVVSPKGEVAKEFAFPKGFYVTNLCFGGPDFKTLYVTVSGKGRVYSLPAPEPGLKLYSHR